MTPSPHQPAPLRLASAATGTVQGRIAYFVANGLDPAQARREAVATIGRAVGHEASVIGSADMIVLLGAILILALAVVLGFRRAAYPDAAGASFAFTPALRPLQHRR
jgi:hypothetical protein